MVDDKGSQARPDDAHPCRTSLGSAEVRNMVMLNPFPLPLAEGATFWVPRSWQAKGPFLLAPRFRHSLGKSDIQARLGVEIR